MPIKLLHMKNSKKIFLVRLTIGDILYLRLADLLLGLLKLLLLLLHISRLCCKSLDMLFYGPLEKCQICNGDLEFDGNRYSCKGTYSEWSSCVYKTRSPARKQEPPKLPDSALNSPVTDKYQDSSIRSHRYVGVTDKPFLEMMISLMGHLSRTHQFWKSKIEKNGGEDSNSIIGITCLVALPAERRIRREKIRREESLCEGIGENETRRIRVHRLER